MKLSRFRGISGFTLTETLIAAILLITVGVGFLSVYTSLNKISAPQVKQTAAFFLAKEKLEELNEAVRQDWWDFQLNSHPLDVNPPGSIEFVPLSTQNYSRQTGVSAVPNKDYRKAEVTVSWD